MKSCCHESGYAVRGLVGLALAAWLLPVPAQQGEPPGGVTVKATRLADFPADAAVRVMPGAGGDPGPELVELAEAILEEQGIAISASGSYTLYLHRFQGPRKAPGRPPVGVSLEGGGRRVETAQVQIPIRSGSRVRRPGGAGVRGLEGNLEGPGGFSYWRVQVLVRDSSGGRGPGEAQLLRHALGAFGRTVVNDVSGERE